MCLGALPLGYKAIKSGNPMWVMSPALAALGVGKKKKPAETTSSAPAASPSYGTSPSMGG